VKLGATGFLLSFEGGDLIALEDGGEGKFVFFCILVDII
jgi:hypothetical protein